jgi:hypothetical protein
LRTQCLEYEITNHLAGETLSNVLAVRRRAVRVLVVVSGLKLPEAQVLLAELSVWVWRSGHYVLN